jgi:hypothetical protein
MSTLTKTTTFSAAQLRKLGEDTAMAEAQKAYAAKKKAEDEKKSMQDAFMAREPHPEAMDRLMTVVRNMAEQGKTELLVFQFPSSYLEDGGRRINNSEPDWPQSLVGFAKRAFDFYEEHLRAQGFRLRAQILDFPNGMPGDVGIFLNW